ncbi:MAG: membrane protein insertion efficiency factor YidD [Oscillospiraceae bacterium]|jgi:putative component of membrane protein insertase Oxa1/YidC/SpoIIIJ protein YidD|nr:membrane protein insertion efficiency factor YidD [Oscillospiraceae bacterium]
MPKRNRQDSTTIWDILDNPAVCDEESRELIRPVIKIKTVIISVFVCLVITGLISFALSCIVCAVLKSKQVTTVDVHSVLFICLLTCYILLFLLSLRRIMIFFVMLYQAKASDQTRLRCVFVPSCSEYMILSLKKYGAIVGLIKGIGRLHRCRNSYGIGGEDYP